MSLSPISTLQKLGIPTHSYIAAAQAAGAMRAVCDHERYNELITKIVYGDDGIEVRVPSFPVAQMTFGYLVQEIVRADLADQILDTPELFHIASLKATEFVERQPWHWPESNNGDGKVTRIEEVRRYVDMFEGINRDVLVMRLCEDFEVTKPTALGWLRHLTNETDASETAEVIKAEPKPKVNKSAEAAKIVAEHYDGNNKAEILDKIVNQLSTSRGGAQTFFYAAVKKLQLTVNKPEKTEVKATTQEKLKTIIEQNPNLDRKGFIEKAGEIGVKATTAQTYYYALTASMGIERQAVVRGRKKEGTKSRVEQVVDYVSANRNLDKATTIQNLSTEFNVSKVSAQSYYYAALKALQNKEPQ